MCAISWSQPLRVSFYSLALTLQQDNHIYINFHNLHTLFLLFFSRRDNHFILIGHLKQCVQSERTRGVPKK